MADTQKMIYLFLHGGINNDSVGQLYPMNPDAKVNPDGGAARRPPNTPNNATELIDKVFPPAQRQNVFDKYLNFMK